MRKVTVYGASGHTGRFVVAELRRRGWTPLVAGRDGARLATLFPDDDRRVAAVADSAALDRAMAGADVVINCAGPFASTVAPVVAAARRAGIAYLDVAAELEAIVDTFDRYADADIPVVPAAAFYGGLGDLLATKAMGDWTTADEIGIAYGLSGWHPTAGTREAGRISRERRDGRRVRYSGGRLEYFTGPAETVEWTFPDGVARSVVTDFTMADSVTIPRHLAVPDIRSHMTTEAAADIADPDTPAPDRDSAQLFQVDVVVRSGAETRRATASGRDIYAVTAPLVVEAAARLGGHPGGALPLGAFTDPRDFLWSLEPTLAVRPG